MKSSKEDKTLGLIIDNKLMFKIHVKNFLKTFSLKKFLKTFRNINDITIQHRNIQTLMIELFKIKYDLAPSFIDSVLNRRTVCYNFRNLQEFQTERKRTVFYGLETVSYRTSQLWTLLP